MTAPSRRDWPNGRMGRIRRDDDYEGCYCLVVPDADDRWVVYVSDDPDQVPPDRARWTDWGFLDSESLEHALLPLDVEWLEAAEDAQEEARVFDLRRDFDRRRAWWRLQRRHRGLGG